MSSQDGPDPAAPPRLRRLRGRRTANPDARMPLLEHLRELRNRVLKALLVIVIGSIAGWYLYRYIWPVIERPYCRLPVQYRLLPGIDPRVQNPKRCTLFVSGLFDALFLHLKIAIAAGVVLTAPIWLYQLWAFVAPGLHTRERRWAYYFGAAAVPLFAAGCGVAYFAMTKGLRFLLGMVSHGLAPLITVNTYVSYALAMLAIFAVAFELPLLMVLLNLAGVLTHQRFRKWRRMIIFLVFAFAAVFTPSPDPISMLLLAVPCVALVELAEIFVWANDRRRARQAPAYPGLTPEELTEYGLDQPLPSDLDDIDAGR
jgi:sec-independent protein translocase protein TatC